MHTHWSEVYSKQVDKWLVYIYIGPLSMEMYCRYIPQSNLIGSTVVHARVVVLCPWNDKYVCALCGNYSCAFEVVTVPSLDVPEPATIAAPSGILSRYGCIILCFQLCLLFWQQAIIVVTSIWWSCFQFHVTSSLYSIPSCMHASDVHHISIIYIYIHSGH